ncbi:hypothetical protein BDZ97DRAFT_194509 [Flammula alnicola]|nr:hypothetical protein BDZ97DRAFT_194509 [Flammula alnicola]
MFTNGIRLQFINTLTPESRKQMPVHEIRQLISCTSTIRTAKYTHQGRKVILVDIPAFNHTELSVENKVPKMIGRWLKKHCSRDTSDTGILYLHAMKLRLNESFNKHLDPFVKLCHNREHRPLSVLLVSTMWSESDNEDNVAILTKELESNFQTPGNIDKIPSRSTYTFK